MQLDPLHFPHAGKQSMLCLRQEHRLVLHPVAKLHLTMRKRFFVARGKSVMIGTTLPSAPIPTLLCLYLVHSIKPLGHKHGGYGTWLRPKFVGGCSDLSWLCFSPARLVKGNYWSDDVMPERMLCYKLKSGLNAGTIPRERVTFSALLLKP